MHYERNDYDEAFDNFTKAVRCHEGDSKGKYETSDQDDADQIKLYNYFGLILMKKCDYTYDAVKYLMKMLEIQELKLGGDHQDVAETYKKIILWR